MLRVRDIMTADVFTVEATMPLGIAAHSLMAQFISGAPVVDEQGTLAGLVAESDLLREILDDPTAVRRPVASAMTPIVWSLGPDEPALMAVRWMLERRIHRVVVVEPPDRLVGIVSTMDVLRTVERGASFAA